jgi:uncharacterized repeat protein (TIGR01451 family)/CSLREA domain-containing protein
VKHDSAGRQDLWAYCRILALFALLLLPGLGVDAATLTVDTTVDEFDVSPNATCSLREAVESANNDADFGGCVGVDPYGDDTILLPAGTYGLTQTPPEPFLDLDNSVGDLDFGSTVAAAALTSGPAAIDRGIILIDSLEILGEGAESTIIERASAEIFGILQTEFPTAVRLVDLTIAGGEQVAGAGIFADFNLSLERVVVRDNVARAPDAGGGGIVSFGALTLVDTLVTGNRVDLEDPCDVGPPTTGGGILALLFDEMLIERSTVSDNVVTGDAGCEGFGGGLGLLAGFVPARIVNSTFSGNSAPYAGGIDLLAEVPFFIPGGVLSPESPRRGNRPSGAPAWARGSTSTAPVGRGTVLPPPEPVFLEHVTVANNSAVEVGGLSILSFLELGEVVLENTLIGNNTADDAPDCTLFGATVTSQGTNLLSIDDPFDGDDDVCLTQPPDLVGTLAAPLDPVLGPLQNNGGLTPTQALLSGSPAIDAAPDQGETEDQRGVARPQGAGFDIGAFEVNEVDLTISKTDSEDPVQRGTAFTYTLVAENLSPNPAVDVEISDSLPVPLTPTSVTPSAGGNCTILVPPAIPQGGGFVSCTFAGGTGQNEQRTVTITVSVAPDATPGSVVVNEAFVSSASPEVDPDPNPNQVEETTTIARADLAITKTAEINGYIATFVVTVTNLGPDDALDVVIDDPLAPGAAFVSATPSMGGVCTTPAVGVGGGTVTCIFAGPTALGEQRSVVIETQVTGPVPNTATTSAATGDPVPDPSPNMATAGVSVVAVPTLGEWGLLLLVTSLMAAGVWWLRR